MPFVFLVCDIAVCLDTRFANEHRSAADARDKGNATEGPPEKTGEDTTDAESTGVQAAGEPDAKPALPGLPGDSHLIPTDKSAQTPVQSPTASMRCPKPRCNPGFRYCSCYYCSLFSIFKNRTISANLAKLYPPGTQPPSHKLLKETEEMGGTNLRGTQDRERKWKHGTPPRFRPHSGLFLPPIPWGKSPPRFLAHSGPPW